VAEYSSGRPFNSPGTTTQTLLRPTAASAALAQCTYSTIMCNPPSPCPALTAHATARQHSVLKIAPTIALPAKKGPSGLRFTRFDWNWYTLYAKEPARGKDWSLLNSTLQGADRERHRTALASEAAWSRQAKHTDTCWRRREHVHVSEMEAAPGR
jgi:hypothetical protein